MLKLDEKKLNDLSSAHSSFLKNPPRHSTVLPLASSYYYLHHFFPSTFFPLPYPTFHCHIYPILSLFSSNTPSPYLTISPQKLPFSSSIVYILIYLQISSLTLSRPFLPTYSIFPFTLPSLSLPCMTHLFPIFL